MCVNINIYLCVCERIHLYNCMCVNIYIYVTVCVCVCVCVKVNLVTLVEGDRKAPFSIAITPTYKGGCYSIPWIAPLYLWALPYNVECLSKAASSTICWVFAMTRPLPNVLLIRPMSRVFANSLGNWGSLPDWVIPKSQKMVFDAALLNTEHYKVRMKGEVEQSREWSSTLLYNSV